MPIANATNTTALRARRWSDARLPNGSIRTDASHGGRAGDRELTVVPGEVSGSVRPYEPGRGDYRKGAQQHWSERSCGEDPGLFICLPNMTCERQGGKARSARRLQPRDGSRDGRPV
jgi:hypothetical protein